MSYFYTFKMSSIYSKKKVILSHLPRFHSSSGHRPSTLPRPLPVERSWTLVNTVSTNTILLLIWNHNSSVSSQGDATWSFSTDLDAAVNPLWTPTSNDCLKWTAWARDRHLFRPPSFSWCWPLWHSLRQAPSNPRSCQRGDYFPSILQFSSCYRSLFSTKLIRDDQKTACNAEATRQGFINITPAYLLENPVFLKNILPC